MSLTQDIKDFALDLGYSGVGITPAEGFPIYLEDLKSRYDMYVWYIEGPRQPILGATPRNIMPSAKSIVSLVYDYSKKSFPENLLGTEAVQVYLSQYPFLKPILQEAEEQIAKIFGDEAEIVYRIVSDPEILNWVTLFGDIWINLTVDEAMDNI